MRLLYDEVYRLNLKIHVNSYYQNVDYERDICVSYSEIVVLCF